jgi:predicted dithiol-disulfide oxidoreductase (DUF899 family)
MVSRRVEPREEFAVNVGHLPNESPEYRKLRDELRQAEIALVDQRERVAALRRQLPVGTPSEDYALREGPTDLDAGDTPLVERRLSELFDDPARPLVLVHFMFGGSQEEPCPMCTLWADGYDGVAPHLAQRVNFGVVVAGDLTRFRAYARERGWRHLRLLSSGGSRLKADLGFETPDGDQLPGVSVFVRANDGVSHFYSGSALLSDDRFRGMDLLCPLWNVLDLTPEGRGDWIPRRHYGT